MPNGQLPQSPFKFQIPAEGIYRVGPVGSGMFFTSIQDAIDQAVADGYTDSSNPATVEVAPGSYTEDLALQPGVNIGGMVQTPGAVVVTGNHTYAVSNGATRTQNSIGLVNMTLTVVNGVLLTMSGTAPTQITLNGVTLQKQSTGDATNVVLMSSSGASTRLRLNAGCTIDPQVAAAVVCDVQNSCILEFRQRNTSIFSSNSVTIDTAVRLAGTAQLNVWGCNAWFGGPATKIIDLQSATAVANIRHSGFQNTLAGGHGVLYTAAGTARLRWTQIQMNTNVTGYIGFGAAGTFQQGSNVIIGTNQQVQNTLTINTDASTVVATP